MEKLQPVTEFTAQDRLRLVKYCNSIVRNRDLAEDFAQDTLVRATEKHEQYHGGSYRAWIHAIARNVCLNHFRNCRENASIEFAERIPSTSPLPQEGILRQQMNTQLRTALASISPIQQEVLELQYFRDMSYADIAQHLGISIPAVKSRVYRAKMSLRKRMVN